MASGIEGKKGMAEVVIARNTAELAELAARHFLTASHAAIKANGRFCVALSGGSTPLVLYRLLSQPPYVDQISWKNIQFFWGDERCVAPDHPDSNFGMARQALLNIVPVQAEQIHRIEGEFGANNAARRYAHHLHTYFGEVFFPVFDLILLGLGVDGHIASLFPASPALNENQRWTAAVEHAIPPPPLVDRVTLTLPVINAAREVVFLASGADKARVIARILTKTDEDDSQLPAQMVHPGSGKITLYVDRLAYSIP